MGNRPLWIILALFGILGGILALMNPFAASLAATTIAGWLFIVFGALVLFAGFKIPVLWAKIWTILLGAFGLYLGVAILAHPLKGLVTLTMVVGIMFLAGGFMKLFIAYAMKQTRVFWPMLFSGAVSVILALMIFSNFPQSADVVLGILLGVQLLSDGVWALAMALSQNNRRF